MEKVFDDLDATYPLGDKEIGFIGNFRGVPMHGCSVARACVEEQSDRRVALLDEILSLELRVIELSGGE